MSYKIVSIEGNIGSGKSTLLENLRRYYSDNSRIIFLEEPVDEWETIKDINGNTILQKFYSDQVKYSFAFQIMAYISRLKILRHTIEHINSKTTTEPQTYILITERSLYTDKYVFAKMLYENGKIEDVCYQIYLKWFEEFIRDISISNFIYVKTDPENCHNRVLKRSRDGEENIPLSYLSECHNYHEDFLNHFKTNTNTNILDLDGNVDIYENSSILESWLKQIDAYIL